MRAKEKPSCECLAAKVSLCLMGWYVGSYVCVYLCVCVCVCVCVCIYSLHETHSVIQPPV